METLGFLTKRAYALSSYALTCAALRGGCARKRVGGHRLRLSSFADFAARPLVKVFVSGPANAYKTNA